MGSNNDLEALKGQKSSSTLSKPSTFMEKVRNACLNSQLCSYDVRVWVSGGTTYRVHKDLFVMASPVFELLLRNSVYEKESSTADVSSSPYYTVKLDIERGVFKVIRHFLYTGELPKEKAMDMDMTLNLLETSFQYEIDRLKQQIIGLVLKRITSESAIKVLQSARAVECPELEDIALKTIHRTADQVLASEDFETLGSYDVCRILSSDELCCDELEVFRAAYRWAQRKANISEKSPRALKYYFSQIVTCIRFPLMTPAEFATVSNMTSKSSLLEFEEIVDLFEYISLPGSETNPILEKYSKKPRSYVALTNTTQKITSKATQTCQVAQTVKQEPTVPPVIPNSNPRKRTVSSDLEGASAGTTTATQPVPDKVMRVQAQDSDSDDNLFNRYSIKVGEKTATTFEEAIRKYEKKNDKDCVTAFNFSNLIIKNNYQNMLFPNCKEVEIQTHCQYFNKSDASFLEFVSHFDPMRYIVFNTKGTIRLTAENIWSLNQDILLKFNGVTFLRVDHMTDLKEKKEDVLVLNYISDSKKIMNNSKFKPTVLALSNCELSVRHIKERGKNLEKLVLYRVWGDYTMEEIMKDFPKLRELVCWKHMPANWIKGNQVMTPLCLNFSNAFSARHNIKKLVLFKTELRFPLRCSNVSTSVAELVLDRCYCVIGERNANIADVFHTVFHVLEKLVIKDEESDNCSKYGHLALAVPSLINSVRKNITSIKYILVNAMKWNETGLEDEQLAKFLEEEAKIKGGKPTNYRIEKAIDNQWTGISMDEKAQESMEIDGGYWTDMDKMEYDYYNLKYFYDSVETFEDYFKQDGNFPRPILWA